jgi:hypothetical protein
MKKKQIERPIYLAKESFKKISKDIELALTVSL